MNRLSRCFPARHRSVPDARRAALAWARQRGAEKDTLEALALAVSEAVANAAVHAYRGQETGNVELLIEETGDGFEVCVSDQGVGMVPRTDSPGLGLGMPLIARVTESVEVSSTEPGGTRVRMRFAG